MTLADNRTFAAGLEAAIVAGVIDRATAERLTPYLITGSAETIIRADPDEEQLRLITGFNDIFVAIGIVMFLGALTYLLLRVFNGEAILLVAIAAWVLAEFFTRKRRMAFPSIVLLVAFVAAACFGVLAMLDTAHVWDSSAQAMIAGITGASAALLHWIRFHVPITVAAGVAALAVIVLALISQAAPSLVRDYPIVVFVSVGLAIFGLAMRFDSSDLRRQTRRTDIAFWLHLLAAPIIVHPILMTIWNSGDATITQSLLVVAVFTLLALVALAVDRRAILVSSLSYLAYAAGSLIGAAGLGSSSLAASILAVGAVMLLLSAGWRPLRRALLGALPAPIRQRVPVVS